MPLQRDPAPRRFAPVRGRTWLVGALLSAWTATAAPAQIHALGDAEDAIARWWNITHGLPQSSINAILQGQDGELWIATHGGLLCFDGLEFRRFAIDTLPGLRSNRITGLTEDGSRGLWFTTQEGDLHHLRDGRLDQSLRVPGPDGALSLLRARDGSLWTAGANGTVQRLADGAWSEVLPGRGASVYRGLCSRKDGVVCAVMRDEIVYFEASGAELARLTAPVPIVSVSPDAANGLWVGLIDGIARADAGAIERFRVEPPIRAFVNVTADDGRGSLWVGTNRGAVRVATRSERAPTLRVRSSSDLVQGFDVRSILLDREGNTWLGGSEAGLIRMRPSRLRLFETEQGQSTVSALCDDGDGGAWVGYLNRGLARIAVEDDEERQEPLDVPGPKPPLVHSLLQDQRGRTWAGVNGSWLRRARGDDASFEPLLEGRLFPPAVGPMAESPDGEVWLATESGHLLRMGVDDVVREELDLPGRIHAVAVAPDKSLWAGSDDQVFCVRAGVVTRFGPEAGLSFGSVRDLLPEAGGGVWIATYGGGLTLLSGGRARTITTRNGLFDGSLSRILFDARDRLWMLSNLGLMIVDRADLMAVLQGRSSRVDPIVIGPEAGMNEASYGGPAGFRDAAGRMWFGMISGAVRVDAHEFPFNRLEPSVRIQRVRTEEAALSPAENLEIPPGTRRLQFEFTAFALTAPERIRFRYRLDGYDGDWVDAGESRQASYTALAPGAYTFHVKARNEDGVWGAEPESLRFELLPAWWQTLAFRLALFLAALAGLIALHRLRLGIVQRRAQALLEATQGRVHAEERSSRLREELAHVARVATAGELATSLAHEVNQPLAAIVTNAEAARRYLARDGVSSAELDSILRDIAQQGERASEVIRRLRQFLRKHETERTAVDVNALVHETLPLVRRELEDQSAALQLDLAEDIQPIGADPVQIQQVLVNLVKNACDAMSDREGDHRILLRTCRTPTGVALEVHDTGPGIAAELRDRLFQPYVTTKAAGMGLGLAICRTIVEAHGGRLGLLSSSSAGAAFRVDLPQDAQRRNKP
ncbi:MAG: triple tyrosine motif-containing protein [Planctomycetota bacterium]|nr:triple tyrosine motif-containing protein [Planctomycetota bacterium]